MTYKKNIWLKIAFLYSNCDELGADKKMKFDKPILIGYNLDGSDTRRTLVLLSPSLQLHEALLCVLQTLQILHHAGNVHSAGFVLHVGKPAAPDPDHYGNHEDEVLHPVVMWSCRRNRKCG